jgi:hypothetical protein
VFVYQQQQRLDQQYFRIGLGFNFYGVELGLNWTSRGADFVTRDILARLLVDKMALF